MQEKTASAQREEEKRTGAGAAAAEPHELLPLEGMWLYPLGEALHEYEIRPVEAADGLSPAASHIYTQRFASGALIWGAVTASLDPSRAGWAAEAELTNGARLRFRREGSRLASSYRTADSDEWQAERFATRPQAFAFYNANDHPLGHRAVQAPGDGRGGFPLVGITSGWVPAQVIEGAGALRASSSSGRVRVRFSGAMCDPFEMAPPEPAGRAFGLQRHMVVPPPRAYGPTSAALAQRPAGGMQLSQRGGSWPGRPPLHPMRAGLAQTARAGGRGLGAQFGRGPLQVIPNPQQEALARQLGCTVKQLWEEALFRQRMRPLPRGQGRAKAAPSEASLPVFYVRLGQALRPRPLLSVLCVRWFDYWSEQAPSSDYNVLNDGMLVDVFDGPCSVRKKLPGDYEVVTVFVRQTSDLRKLDPRHLRGMLRGQNVVAWYFVWPSCADAVGFVSEAEFFAFLQGMERLSVRTGWPHQSHLYRILAGKLWIASMCLNKAYRIPPTTRIHYAEFRQNKARAVARALDCLMRLRERIWGREPAPLDGFRGVAKLGFSWGGQDVLPFKGTGTLVRALTQLFDGAGENVSCLVQELVPGVVGEHRVLCFHDKARGKVQREPVWMESIKPAPKVKHVMPMQDVEDFKLATPLVLPQGKVVSAIFGGDSVAFRAAEAEAQRLVDAWLLWFKTEQSEPPQVIRLDFLVAHPGPGRAEVWTCEVGECGTSLCSVEVHGRNLAALNNAVLRDPQGRFPEPLPLPLPRNDGAKSLA